MPRFFTNDPTVPDCVLEAHEYCVPTLARLILDPRLNRIQIEEAIRGDELMMMTLNGYETVCIRQMRPRPASPTRFGFGEIDIRRFHFDGQYRGCYPEPKLIPRILGIVQEPKTKDVWWVGSNQEFQTFDRRIQTSNIGTEPDFEFRVEGEPRPTPRRKRRRRTA